MRRALLAALKPWLGDDFWMADKAHHAFCDVAGRTRDRDPAPLARPIRIPGSSYIGHAISEAWLNEPELIQPGWLSAKDCENRLDDRHIDDLAAAALLASTEGKHDGGGGRQPSDAIRQTEGRQRRRATGLPVMAANPFIASASVPKPGRFL